MNCNPNQLILKDESIPIKEIEIDLKKESENLNIVENSLKSSTKNGIQKDNYSFQDSIKNIF